MNLTYASPYIQCSSVLKYLRIMFHVSAEKISCSTILIV